MIISFSGIMLADYFIVRRRTNQEDTVPVSVQQVNRGGVITIISTFILSRYILDKIIPVEFVTALIASLLLYPLLYRLFHQGRQL